MAGPASVDKEAVTNVEDIEEAKRMAPAAPHVDGDALILDRTGAVRKLPVPSSNPNDPLNFSRFRKIGIIVACCWFSTMSLTLVGGLGAILGVFFGLC